ncbi:MAG TPA: RNA polymerase sigma-70 factor [Puia sp.]|jgi:RNA polymerase sigma-70 factor (ECF subfamily)|nr:RNA polymerase sigma-70 factor [Puia sp.]
MPPGRYHLHEDKLLLSLLRQGDQHAFDTIYNRYARELLVRAHYKTGVKEISEDIVQDVFTGLWVKREQIEVRQSLGAYLNGILDHKIIDYYRQACTHLRHIDHLIEMLDQPEISPIDKMAYKEQESALHAYISGLSEKMRAIFILSRYERLSTDEISQKLSLSNQTVRNQISKALKILREKLASPPGRI